MKRFRRVIIICALAAAPTIGSAQPFIAETRTFAYDFCPAGWLETNGQLLPVSQFDALFTLIGTTYGGDGQTTFGLPDLRGRVIIHVGNGYIDGEVAGVETATLTVNQIASHAHSVPGAGAPPAVSVPTATKGAMASVRTSAATAAANTQSSGGGQPHDERQPYLAMLTCMAVEGIFPSQI